MTQSSFTNDLPEHYHSLKAFFTRRISDADVAEDLTQETFVRALASSDFEQKDHKRYLLFAIAANLANDFIRKKYKAERTSPLGSALELISAKDDPLDALQFSERTQQLDVALSELTPRCREVFLLHRVCEMSYSEIAAELGISISAVEKHIIKALRHCRQRLSHLK